METANWIPWTWRVMIALINTVMITSFMGSNDLTTSTAFAIAYSWANILWGMLEMKTNKKWRRKLKEDAVADYKKNGQITRP